MTPFTQSVPISPTLATQSFVGGSHVYQPSIQHLAIANIQLPQKSFGILNSFTLLKVQELRQNLSNLEGVEDVKAIFQNVHSVVFQIKLSSLSEYKSFDEDNLEFEYEIESNNSDQLWDVAQDLVLKTCCHLRDITGEKWYFFTQIVEDFTNQVIDS